MASAASAQMTLESESGKHKVLGSGVQIPTKARIFTIPLEFYQCATVPAITVTPVYSRSEPRKDHLVVNIPEMPKASAKKIKITQSDPNLTPEWTDFVVENFTSIVDNCATVVEFEKWSEAIDGEDASFLLEFMWTRANEKDRFWKIGKSRVEIYRKYWPNAKSAGSGLFCIREGKHKIEFGRPPETCWVQKEPEANGGQERFGLGPNIFNRIRDKNIVGWCVPSDLSLRTGLIHHGFKVNFVCKKGGNPTHKLKFEHGSYYLSPLRKVRVGEEFTYDYNYYQWSRQHR